MKKVNTPLHNFRRGVKLGGGCKSHTPKLAININLVYRMQHHEGLLKMRS
jgi:hypothetical protein